MSGYTPTYPNGWDKKPVLDGQEAAAHNAQDAALLFATPLIDTAANLAALVPKLGQAVRETDTGRERVGDGSTAVASLPMKPKRWRVRGASRWAMVNDYGLGMSSTPFAEGNVQWVPADIDEALTIDTWGTTVLTVGVGGVQTQALALYAVDLTTNLPTGSPVLSVDTRAPVIDLTGGSIGLRTATLSSTVTIPPGRYWWATLTRKTGAITTQASTAFLNGPDPRITATGATPYGNFSYASALLQAGQTGFPTSPSPAGASSYGPAIWLRQTA